MNKTHISDLDYHLPKSSIAQDPYQNPEDSKILDAESMIIHKFENIDNVIPDRSLIVFNNSQVIDARVKTIKKHTHGNVEIFILKIIDEYKEEIIDLAIENNCIDIQENETGVTFEFQPSEFQKVDQLFRNSGFNLVNSEVAYLPSSSVILDIEKFNRLSKLIEALEDLDDVQNVYANFDIDNKLLEKAITE